MAQSAFPLSVIVINETNSLNETNSYYNHSSESHSTNPVPLDTSNSTTYKQPDPVRPFSLPVWPNQNQIVGSDVTLPTSVTEINEANSLNENNSYNNSSSASPTTEPISFESSNFTTYTYGGYSVQQPDMAQFYFSFPDNTNQGQLAGSDALSLNAYAIQRIDFDAAFIAPKISALGFDEMVIFVTSDVSTYKGTEFGIRMDLKDGFIYGYVQEPNGNFGEVNFEMQELISNDGVMHHYTSVMLGSDVSFYIDGIPYGDLIFPSNADYSSCIFSICAVVHRFTDGWDSNGDIMTAANFSLSQK